MSRQVSLIVTVFNEAHTIIQLLDALALQTRLPNEIVITDGGSTDSTVQLIKVWSENHSKIPLQLAIHPGNRSIGRNRAIAMATHDLVAITDAGCIPHTTWLEELLKTATQTKAEVVAGYYDAKPKTSLQAAIIPYIFVMPDRVNPDHFLPATRSMLITRSAWRAVGGFNETLNSSEDYIFAKKLKKSGRSIAFTSAAVVTWLPMMTLAQFWQTILAFAHHDVLGGVIRFKVILIFMRYIALIFLVGFVIIKPSLLVWSVTMILVLGYLYWSIAKNKRYVRNGWQWLPVLQLISDLAVLLGSITGLRIRWLKQITQ